MLRSSWGSCSITTRDFVVDPGAVCDKVAEILDPPGVLVVAGHDEGIAGVTALRWLAPDSSK
jgi:hypothetical protein